MGWSLLARQFSVRGGQTLLCGRAGGNREPRIGCAKWGEGEDAAVSSFRFGFGRTRGIRGHASDRAVELYSPVPCAPCVETDFMSAEMMDDLPTPSSPISATRISRGAISLSPQGE